ncbi:MAG: phosphoglucosamine mutase [Dehalococcoidia bacterium]|nr:phosphoglucosamine mutase [Dehalococcoidia bacterium]
MKLFGSSGIRRLADRTLLEIAFQAGLAAGNAYSSVVVGTDTRTSSDSLRYAFVSGLLAGGASASYAGITPTPTLAYAARLFHAGTMITASHNPPQYNGLKLVNPDGSAFDAQQRTALEGVLSAQSASAVAWEEFGKCVNCESAISDHLDRITKDFPGPLRARVVVDCCCGAACEATPVLLTRLGCDVVRMNCEHSGFFPREIEPRPENLVDLAKTVRSQNADLGIAHDGDADRIAVIDENGEFVPADKLMALFAIEMKAETIVTTVDASMIIDEIGLEVTRTKVGDAFVSDELRKDTRLEARFGGESSGCFIFPHISLCPDAIYAAALAARLAGERKVSSLVSEIPSYPVIRGSVAAGDEPMAFIEARLRRMQESAGKLETLDGLRFALTDGWLLIRPSGTEPKIRITAEAKTESRARELFDLGIRLVKDSVHDCKRAST